MTIFEQVAALEERTRLNNFVSHHCVETRIAVRFGIQHLDVLKFKESEMNVNFLIKIYLARKVFFNDFNHLLDSEREKDVEFTKGLWDIICIETYGKKIPELSVPTTYNELQLIYDNIEEHKKFNFYETITEAVMHNQLVNSGVCQSEYEFDLHCGHPVHRWSGSNYYAGLSDGRQPSAIGLMRMAVGLYMYDSMGVPEPYKHFWVERSEKIIKKAVAVSFKSIIIHFRIMREFQKLQKHRFTYRHLPPIKDFKWNPYS